MDDVKHKVFISYYDAEDHWYKDRLLNMNKVQEIFQDYSVHDNDIDDKGLTDERVREIIRDDFIKDATVLILLCGLNTKKRKFIDWELKAAMFDSEKNPKLGILVINLPGADNMVRAAGSEEKDLIGSEIPWQPVSHDRITLENRFPYMPSRIIDNFVDGVPISVVNWNRIEDNGVILMKLIDIANNRKGSCTYNNSAPLWGRNRK
mgnify:CR=1 FL=1